MIKEKGKTTEEEYEYILDKEINLDESNISQDQSINDTEMNIITYTSDDFDERKNNEKQKEEEIETKISSKIGNARKNASSIIRGIGEVGSVILKALPTAGEITLESGAIVFRTGINIGVKAASWVFLPITCIGFGTWSLFKVDNDCQKILGIFDEAFTPLRFETLLNYSKSFRNAIDYLQLVGQKIIEDDKEEQKKE